MGFSRWWEPCKEAECGRSATGTGYCARHWRERVRARETELAEWREEIDSTYAALPGAPGNVA